MWFEKKVFTLCNLSDLLIEQSYENTAWGVYISLIREKILSISDVSMRMGVDIEVVLEKNETILIQNMTGAPVFFFMCKILFVVLVYIFDIKSYHKED